jgi:predicted O-methyltransferase YrrM
MDSRKLPVQERLRVAPFLGSFRAGPELYALIRALRPRTVVETGVGSGYSSTFILEALRRNDEGRLVSIDLPNCEAGWSLTEDEKPGFLVPDVLRSRWDLRLGRTVDLLPDVLTRLGHIDLFFHDSEHTYDVMSFEYSAAYEHLTPSGVIISDDSMWNTAMIDFAKTVGQRIHFVYHAGGSAPITFIRKPAFS